MAGSQNKIGAEFGPGRLMRTVQWVIEESRKGTEYISFGSITLVSGNSLNNSLILQLKRKTRVCKIL